MAKKLILLSADKYDTSFSLSQYVSHVPAELLQSHLMYSKYPLCSLPAPADEAGVSSQS